MANTYLDVVNQLNAGVFTGELVARASFLLTLDGLTESERGSLSTALALASLKKLDAFEKEVKTLQERVTKLDKAIEEEKEIRINAEARAKHSEKDTKIAEDATKRAMELLVVGNVLNSPFKYTYWGSRYIFKEKELIYRDRRVPWLWDYADSDLRRTISENEKKMLASWTISEGGELGVSPLVWQRLNLEPDFIKLRDEVMETFTIFRNKDSYANKKKYEEAVDKYNSFVES